MIAQLTGRCVGRGEDSIVLDVNGVGYALRATSAAIVSATQQTPVTVQTYLHVREDTLQLFGFASEAERAIFEQLMSLQGIGPKVALSIVSAFDPGTIHRAALAGDVSLFTTISGVGPKVARRIATELKDKLGADEAQLIAQIADSNAAAASVTFYQARDALVELGMSLAQAEAALAETDDDDPIDVRIKAALKASRA